MYPMPLEILAEIFNSESKAFQKVADEKHNCIAPLNSGGHSVVLFSRETQRKYITLIRLEITQVKEYLISSINVSFTGIHITTKLSYNMIPISVVFRAVFSLMYVLNT